MSARALGPLGSRRSGRSARALGLVAPLGPLGSRTRSGRALGPASQFLSPIRINSSRYLYSYLMVKGNAGSTSKQGMLWINKGRLNNDLPLLFFN
ncbi:unnamed protein product [Pleuronectes platessa]|uniref:Uncharacterized protein n=1 Tax=Pleuronectes platessa TaxID=8262 RepID=A0A9N7YR47_PLEPL|nr:unnamed protein product [Pleuronectes platessa]